MSLYVCARRIVGLLAFGFVFVLGALCPAQNFPVVPHPNSHKTVKSGAPPAVSSALLQQFRLAAGCG